MNDTPKRPPGWQRGSKIVPGHFRTRGALGRWEIFFGQREHVRLTLTADGKCLLEEVFSDIGQAIQRQKQFDLRAEAKATGRRAAQVDYDSLGNPISAHAAAGAPGLGKKG